MSTWLVTGATGLLGSNAALQLGRQHHVIASARAIPLDAPVTFVAADLRSAAGRTGLVEKASADTVLHCAAISSIDECEREPEMAHEVNVLASADLAEQARSSGARFVYISTDAVFDGARGGYSEADEPSPTTEYGRSKLAGERAVLEANPNALVARVNFYGWSPDGHRSLAEFFYNRLSRAERVPGFDDAVVSTMYVGHLIEVLEHLVDLGANGVFNVVSSESTTKYDFGRRLAKAFGFPQESVYAARSTDHLAIKRGSRLNLSTERIESLLGTLPPGQQNGIDRLVADRKSGRADAIASFRTR